jgi:ribosomal protein L32
MADEPSKIILGDTAITSIERSGERRLFRSKGRQRPPLTHCENCGEPLVGHYCAKCGQPAIDYRRSFRHVILDILDSFLNWDSKFVASIGLLLTTPWRLTNEFLSGKRVRHVNPLRLYLLASILFFFVVNYWTKDIRVDSNRQLSPKDRAELNADLNKEDLPPEARAAIENALRGASPAPSPATSAPPQSTPAAQSTPGAEPEPTQPAFFQSGKPTTPFEKWIEAKAKEKFGEHGTKFGIFIHTLISNLPYMMLCCIPLFALVLKMLYIRRKIFYIDHLVYALHIHAFVYLATMLLVLATIGLSRSVPGALGGWIIAVLWTTFAVQIFLSIRRVYRQNWFVSIFKFFFGGFIYLVVLSLGLATTFLITVIMP